MDLKVEIYFISAKGMKESRKISPGYDRNKQLCRYRGKSCRKPLSNRLIYGESRIHNHFSESLRAGEEREHTRKARTKDVRPRLGRDSSNI